MTSTVLCARGPAAAAFHPAASTAAFPILLSPRSSVVFVVRVCDDVSESWSCACVSESCLAVISTSDILTLQQHLNQIMSSIAKKIPKRLVPIQNLIFALFHRCAHPPPPPPLCECAVCCARVCPPECFEFLAASREKMPPARACSRLPTAFAKRCP